MIGSKGLHRAGNLNREINDKVYLLLQNISQDISGRYTVIKKNISHAQGHFCNIRGYLHYSLFS